MADADWVTVDNLLAYIRNKMAMQHVYQPVLIRAVDAGGAATSRQLAMAYLVEDEEVVQVAEERLRRMPVPVLKRNEVISTEPGGVLRLNAANLSVQDRERVRLACEERLRALVVQRDFWAEGVRTMPTATPYAVFKAADFRCLACRDTTRPSGRSHSPKLQRRHKDGDEPAGALRCLQPGQEQLGLDRLPIGLTPTPGADNGGRSDLQSDTHRETNDDEA